MSRKRLDAHSGQFDETDKLTLKLAHQLYPLLVAPDSKIFLFTDSKLYRVAYQFLVCVAQPIFRPVQVQEYKITKFSLYTAMVLNFSTSDILKILARLTKNSSIPPSVVKFVQQNTRHYGGARLSLNGSSYFLLLDQQLTVWLRSNRKQMFSHLQNRGEFIYREQGLGMAMLEQLQEQQRLQARTRKMNRFEVVGDYFQVTRPLIETNVTIIQEYDFENDQALKLDINLKPNTSLRSYQQRALKNIFIDGKARSGLIVLPCGAGKTLVAVTALERIKRKALIICDGDVSVQQWKDQFLKWTTLDSRKLIRITGKVKDKIDFPQHPFIAITTYSMVTRNRESEKQVSLVTLLKKGEWGACIADEVHKLPAQTFQNVLRAFKFNVKLGFTATPYREDGKIDKLFYMIGPKLYQQNWLDLVNQGALAKPYCVQVRCKMSQIFKQEYQRLGREELLHTANPNKFSALKYLIKVHESRGDKILVFCDRPKVLEYLAQILKKPFIHGEVKHQLRKDILYAFKRESLDFQTLFISRVGDVAIDLPVASVAIQIGYHYGSRRQQVQRLGRIMRPKDSKAKYSAFFYSLVSVDTDQQFYASQRRSCLVNLGLDFQVINQQSLQPRQLGMSRKQQLQFLSYILANHREGDKFIEKSSQIRNVGKQRCLFDHIGGVYGQVNNPFQQQK